MPEREYNFSREVTATVNGNTVTAGPAIDGYYYSPSAGGSNASPKTADAGMALYAAAALLSTAGLAWSSKRRGQ